MKKNILLLLACVQAASGLTVREINNRYWNLQDAGWKTFSFVYRTGEAQKSVSASAKILEQRGHVRQAREIRNLKVNVNWIRGREVKASAAGVSPTGDAKLDSGISRMRDGYEMMAAGFTNQWLGMIREPLITGYAKDPEISTSGDTVRVRFVKNKAVQEYRIYNNYRTLAFSRSETGRNVSGTFSMKSRNGKLVPEKVEMKSAAMAVHLKLKYSGPRMIPDEVNGGIDLPGQQTNVSIRLAESKFRK